MDNNPFDSHDYDLIAKCKCGCPLVIHSSNERGHHFECPSCFWSELEELTTKENTNELADVS